MAAPDDPFAGLPAGLPAGPPGADDEAQAGGGYPPKFARQGLTFDDVLLVPAESAVLPAEVSTATRLTPRIELSIPIVSAAMDTVTESRLAIAIARAGGIGIVHRNLSVDDQVAEVDKVKRNQSGMIVDPVTLPAEALVTDALALMERYHISGVPITDGDGRLVGLLTNRDLRFIDDVDQPIANVMRRAAARHRPARHHARAGEGHPLEEPHREAADRRRPGLPQGAHHGQGHQEAGRAPALDAGREGPPAGGGRGRRRARRPPRGPSVWSPPGSTCSSSTPPTATAGPCSTWSSRSRAPSRSRSSPATWPRPRPSTPWPASAPTR